MTVDGSTDQSASGENASGREPIPDQAESRSPSTDERNDTGSAELSTEEHSGEEHSGEEHSGEEHSGEEHSGEENSGEEHSGEDITPQAEALRRQQYFVGVGASALAGFALALGSFQQYPDLPTVFPVAAGIIGGGVVFWIVRNSLFPTDAEVSPE